MDVAWETRSATFSQVSQFLRCALQVCFFLCREECRSALDLSPRRHKVGVGGLPRGTTLLREAQEFADDSFFARILRRCGFWACVPGSRLWSSPRGRRLFRFGGR